MGGNTDTLLGSLYLFYTKTGKVWQYNGKHERRLFSSKVENVGGEGSCFMIPHFLAQEMTVSLQSGQLHVDSRSGN
jgi:hypothetical protein